MEFDYPELYAPLDLGIGHCRMSVAEPAAMAGEDDPARWSHIRVATKYPEITRRHFAAARRARGMHSPLRRGRAGPISRPLPAHRRSRASGSTLRANRLTEMEIIADITSRLIVNRAALKTRADKLQPLIERFRKAAAHAG